LTVVIVVLIHTLVAFLIDIRTRKIPNNWNWTVLICGLTYHVVNSGWSGLSFSLAGGLALLLVTTFLYTCGAIGGGDVKWFAALGSWCGVWFTMNTLVYTFLIGGTISVVILMFKGRLLNILKQWIIAIVCLLGDKKLSNLKVINQQPLHEIPLMIAALPAVAIILLMNGGQ